MTPLTDTQIDEIIREKHRRGGKVGRPSKFDYDQSQMIRRCYTLLITYRSQADIAQLFGIGVPTLMKMVKD